MDIILDTNFLLIPGEFKVDIFSEIERIATFKYDLIVLDKVIDELNKIIEEQKGKHKANAKLGLELVKNKGLKIKKTETLKNVDEIIVEIAEKDSTIVATQDLGLKTRLRRKGVKTISLRQKTHLSMQ